jgi:hypothetical protein
MAAVNFNFRLNKKKAIVVTGARTASGLSLAAA